jgi:hypothetical protein
MASLGLVEGSFEIAVCNQMVGLLGYGSWFRANVDGAWCGGVSEDGVGRVECWSDGALEFWSTGTETTGAGATPNTTRERVAGADPELDRWEVGLVEFLFCWSYRGNKTVYAWFSWVRRGIALRRQGYT